MSKNVTAPMQFSLGELFFVTAMTFLGMCWLGAIIVSPFFGALSAIVATVTGATFAFYLNSSERFRLPFIALCIASSWLLALVIYLAIIAGNEFWILLVLLISPSAAFIVSFAACFDIPSVRARHFAALFLTIMLFGYICEAVIVPYFFLRSPITDGRTSVQGMMMSYAEAQEIYHRTDYNGDGILEYAQHMKGPRSLLMNDTTEIALIDRAFAAAEGADSERPKAGYLFKILYAQGPDAAGGAKSYVDANGRMTKGYALIAWPAACDSTGRDSYMISNQGTIYQSDLGPDTARIVAKMTEFNPTAPLWTPTE
jgi:hypothetical protein